MPVTVATYDPARLASLLPSQLDRADARDVTLSVLLRAPADSRYAPGIYTLGLDHLADPNNSPKAAELVGTRYLALLGGVAAAAEVYNVRGRQRVASITAGQIVNQAIDSIRAVTRMRLPSDASYQVHTFRIPGVLTEAYWLKSDGGDDLFVPYVSPETKLVLGQAYSWVNFWELLDTAAGTNRIFFESDAPKTSRE